MWASQYGGGSGAALSACSIRPGSRGPPALLHSRASRTPDLYHVDHSSQVGGFAVVPAPFSLDGCLVKGLKGDATLTMVLTRGGHLHVSALQRAGEGTAEARASAVCRAGAAVSREGDAPGSAREGSGGAQRPPGDEPDGYRPTRGKSKAVEKPERKAAREAKRAQNSERKARKDKAETVHRSTSVSKEQAAKLKALFALDAYPTREQRDALVQEFGIERKVVTRWFHHSRLSKRRLAQRQERKKARDGLHRDDRDREERQRAAEDREAELIPLLSRMPVLPHPLSHFAELQGVGPDSAARAAAAQERARATHLEVALRARFDDREMREVLARARDARLAIEPFEAALEEACAVLDICETELKEIEDAAVDASESAENDGRADLPSLDLETERDEWAKAVQVARRRVHRAQTDLARERPKHRRVACAALEAAAARGKRKAAAREEMARRLRVGGEQQGRAQQSSQEANAAGEGAGAGAGDAGPAEEQPGFASLPAPVVEPVSSRALSALPAVPVDADRFAHPKQRNKGVVDGGNVAALPALKRFLLTGDFIDMCHVGEETKRAGVAGAVQRHADGKMDALNDGPIGDGEAKAVDRKGKAKVGCEGGSLGGDIAKAGREAARTLSRPPRARELLSLPKTLSRKLQRKKLVEDVTGLRAKAAHISATVSVRGVRPLSSNKDTDMSAKMLRCEKHLQRALDEAAASLGKDRSAARAGARLYKLSNEAKGKVPPATSALRGMSFAQQVVALSAPCPECAKRSTCGLTNLYVCRVRKRHTCPADFQLGEGQLGRLQAADARTGGDGGRSTSAGAGPSATSSGGVADASGNAGVRSVGGSDSGAPSLHSLVGLGAGAGVESTALRAWNEAVVPSDMARLPHPVSMEELGTAADAPRATSAGAGGGGTRALGGDAVREALRLAARTAYEDMRLSLKTAKTSAASIERLRDLRRAASAFVCAPAVSSDEAMAATLAATQAPNASALRAQVLRASEARARSTLHGRPRVGRRARTERRVDERAREIGLRAQENLSGGDGAIEGSTDAIVSASFDCIVAGQDSARAMPHALCAPSASSGGGKRSARRAMQIVGPPRIPVPELEQDPGMEPASSRVIQSIDRLASRWLEKDGWPHAHSSDSEDVEREGAARGGGGGRRVEGAAGAGAAGAAQTAGTRRHVGAEPRNRRAQHPPGSRRPENLQGRAHPRGSSQPTAPPSQRVPASAPTGTELAAPSQRAPLQNPPPSKLPVHRPNPSQNVTRAQHGAQGQPKAPQPETRKRRAPLPLAAAGGRKSKPKKPKRAMGFV